MSAVAARACLPGLIEWTRRPIDEAALLERVALTLSGYTPSLTMQPEGLALELEASRRLFGGVRALARAIRQDLHACGIVDFGWAVGATAQAAFLLARLDPRREDEDGEEGEDGREGGQGRGVQEGPTGDLRPGLDALPLQGVITAWQLPAELARFLQGIGCRTLGQLRALPARGLQRRGAQPLLDLAAQAYGEAPDPQRWYEPPPGFEMKLELWHRIDEAAALVFAAQRLVQPLAAWLSQRWLAASGVSLRLKHEGTRRRGHPDTVLNLHLSEASRDAAHIDLLLRERLPRLSLPAPVYALSLKLEGAVPLAGHAGAFWRDAAARGEGERELIDRLSARLGNERVLRVRLQADHRPERAQRWLPALAAETAPLRPPTAAGATPAPAVAKDRPSRPTWLLPQPRALREVDHRPLHDGLPLLVDPAAERIEAGWFDGEAVSRDYHLAMDARQRRYWIFRERSGEHPGRWFLHGIFG